MKQSVRAGPVMDSQFCARASPVAMVATAALTRVNAITNDPHLFMTTLLAHVEELA